MGGWRESEEKEQEQECETETKKMENHFRRKKILQKWCTVLTKDCIASAATNFTVFDKHFGIFSGAVNASTARVADLHVLQADVGCTRLDTHTSH